MTVNGNFSLLPESYLFAEVGRRVAAFRAAHPDSDIIRMDIGDVTLPVVAPVAEAMKKAAEEMMSPELFRGYGPEQGYAFLREAVVKGDYEPLGVDVNPDEIFISDGAKCDIANLTDIFDRDCVVGIPDPVYPVYVDSNIMAGRTVENGRLVIIRCDPSAGYRPVIPDRKIDVIYLCSPDNPTGSVLGRNELESWVDYARRNESLIIFDSAYEAFVRDSTVPRSIYEIPGARSVAVEVRSFSKTAGFTGLRCGYTVVPRELVCRFPDGSEVELRRLWLRRQTTKFNGASYIIQRGAEAVYSPEGRRLIKDNIDYYLRNAGLLRKAFEDMGFTVSGGLNSPYVWVKDKTGRNSWDLFDLILQECMVSTTPGVGFGSAGEGCIRLTGFNSHENTLEAIKRLAIL